MERDRELSESSSVEEGNTMNKEDEENCINSDYGRNQTDTEDEQDIKEK